MLIYHLTDRGPGLFGVRAVLSKRHILQHDILKLTDGDGDQVVAYVSNNYSPRPEELFLALERYNPRYHGGSMKYAFYVTSIKE